MRWVEVNVCIGTGDPAKLRSVVLDLVGPLVDEFKNVAGEGYSWHFLWESSPYPLTLRLRFRGSEEAIGHVKKRFKSLWESLRASKPDVYCDHYCYGRHGVCCEEYVGEEDAYGPEGWRLVERILNFSSEVVLELARNYENIGPDKVFKGSLYLYIDRYVHLFLNQVTSLESPSFELNFLLNQFVQRYFRAILGIDVDKLPEPERKKVSEAISEAINEVASIVIKKAEALKRSLGLVP